VVHTGVLAPYFGNQEQVGIGTALTVNTSEVMKRWFTDHNIEPACQTIMEGSRENLFRAPPAYPARPLDGYWATGPFLHNGSVRTLYQLLSPVNERESSFWLGSWEFDPVEVGFVNGKVKGGFLYDTSLVGNSNAGHEFHDAAPNTPGVIGPSLTREQRLDIIEYMKVMDTVQIPAMPVAERSATLQAASSFYENASTTAPVGAPEAYGGFKKKDFCDAMIGAAQPTTPLAVKQEKAPTTTNGHGGN
jgi:hypothetical protein